MKVIDSSNNFSELKQKCKDSDIILLFIPNDHRVHPEEQDIIGVYIQTLNNNCSYYISICHEESIKNFTIEEVLEVINLASKKYVRDIKDIPSKINLKDFHCCNSSLYYCFGKTIEVENTPAHKKLYSMYWDRTNVNKIIPIYKHIESCQIITNKIVHTINSPEFDSCKNNETMKDYLINLRKIESSGLYTTDKKLERCKYNPYTLTGRPSNTFNKTNYAALNKSDGTRNKYISRFENGAILELDYDAYHLRIIAEIIGYDLPDESIHQYLGKQYFSKSVLSDKEYNEAKQISFQILYGGIPKEFLSIPFFSKVNEFILKFWQKWKTKNHFETYLYKRKVSETVIGEMTPQKLFNYYIQSAETELNSEAMKRVFDVISNYKTRFILYTYDSFTFDFDMNEGKELILQIKDAMKYPTKVSVGSNYGDLKDVS